MSVIEYLPITEGEISDYLFRDLVDHAERALEAQLPRFVDPDPEGK